MTKTVFHRVVIVVGGFIGQRAALAAARRSQSDDNIRDHVDVDDAAGVLAEPAGVLAEPAGIPSAIASIGRLGQVLPFEPVLLEDRLAALASARRDPVQTAARSA